jgi:hypothetical protein
MSTDNRPAWVKTSVTIWEEDDAKPEGREQRGEAWQRLFGCPEPDHAAVIESYDGGDHQMFLHEHGRIAGISYMGESIEMTADEAVKFVRVQRNDIWSRTRLCDRIEVNIAKVRVEKDGVL